MFEPLTASLLPDPAVSPLERFRAEGAAVLAGGHTTIRSRSLTVLRAIDTLIRTHGQSPTVREIMQACGYQSTGSVAYQITQLAAHNLVSCQPRHARSLTLTPQGIALLTMLDRQWQLATADYRALKAGKTW